jgi:hypothetical protein
VAADRRDFQATSQVKAGETDLFKTVSDALVQDRCNLQNWVPMAGSYGGVVIMILGRWKISNKLGTGSAIVMRIP